MAPDPMDRPFSRPPRTWRPPLCVGLGVAGGMALLATGLIADTGSPGSPPAIAGGKADLPAAPQPPAPDRYAEPEEPVPETLADAFEAATGKRTTYRVIEHGNIAIIRPVKIIALSFGPVLITEKHYERRCRPCTDEVGVAQLDEKIGIHYLREKAGKFTVTGSWPEAFEGSEWGNPPAEWKLTNRFTAYPALLSFTSSSREGVVHEGATITELRPSGPVSSDWIGTYYSDEKARASDDWPICIAKGRIANVRKDRSFDVVVTGFGKHVDRYVKRNGRFEAGETVMWHIPCGDRDGYGAFQNAPLSQLRGEAGD